MAYRKKPAPSPTSSEDRLYSPGEAAKYLGLAPQTLAHWRVRGCGPRFIHLSRRCIRYSEQVLHEFLDRRTLEATCQPLPDTRGGK